MPLISLFRRGKIYQRSIAFSDDPLARANSLESIAALYTVCVYKVYVHKSTVLACRVSTTPLLCSLRGGNLKNTLKLSGYGGWQYIIAALIK